MAGTGRAQAQHTAAYLTNDNGQISIYQTLYTFTQENIQHRKYGMKPSLAIRTYHRPGQKEFKHRVIGRVTRRNDQCLEKRVLKLICGGD